MSELVTIQKAAEMAGLSPRTLRFYEGAGLLPATARSEAGYRLFSLSDVRRLRLIRRAKILGLSLADIKELADVAFDVSCGAFEERLGLVIAQRLAEIERTIGELEVLRTELNDLQVSLSAEGCCSGTCRVDDCDHCRFVDD